MGRGGGVVAGRAPSQAAYYVALAGVALLLLMLCCYFLYFCITKIHELSEHESLCGAPRARAAPPAPPRAGYPVQPVVRDSATAMAKLCKDLPKTETPAASGSLGVEDRGVSGAGDTRGVTEGGETRGGGRGGSVASAATLSEDTATTCTGDSAAS